MTFAEVAEMIGIDRTKVGNLYRDQAIANQAKALGIETGNVERSFSLLTVAMGTTGSEATSTRPRLQDRPR